MYTVEGLSEHGPRTAIIGPPGNVNCVEPSSRRGLRSCGVDAASLGYPSAEALAFLRRQPRPAVGCAGPPGPGNHPESAKAPEQDPARSHQTDRLPEPKGPQAKQLWHQPVPKL